MRLVITVKGGGAWLWPRGGRLATSGSGDAGETPVLAAWRRARRLLPPDRIYVAANEPFADLVRAQLPDLAESNLVLQPVDRGTAAAVGLAAACIERVEPDSVMVVVRADRLADRALDLPGTLRAAARAAEADDRLVAVAWPRRVRRPGPVAAVAQGPAEAAHGAGAAAGWDPGSGGTAAPASERPDDLPYGPGIFACRSGVLLRALATQLPHLYTVLNEVARQAGFQGESRHALRRAWSQLQSVSVERSLLRRGENVAMLPPPRPSDHVERAEAGHAAARLPSAWTVAPVRLARADGAVDLPGRE